MRWLVPLMAVSATAVAAPKASNPTFLGIGMHDSQYASAMQPPRVGPCVIDSVTSGGGAQAAGVQPGDTILRLDGAQIENCDALVTAVTAHEPSEVVSLEVLRDGRARTLRPRLSSRGELFHNRYAGRSVALDAIGLDDGHSIELARTKPTIVGWFSPRCTSCKALLARVADWAAAHKDAANALAVTLPTGPDDLSTAAARTKLQASYALDLPLALVQSAEGDELLFGDPDRATLMVVDVRGTVRYVSPISPDASDTDAALDELYAAAAQARK